MHHEAYPTAADREGSPLDELQQLQARWTTRCQNARRQFDELSERTFVGSDSWRRARVSLDGGGIVTEVRIDRRQAHQLSHQELAAAALEAEHVARQSHAEAHNAAFRDLLGVDDAEFAELSTAFDGSGTASATATVASPTDTGFPEVDNILAQANEFRNATTALVVGLMEGTASGASRDGLVRAKCSIAGSTVELQIDPQVMRRHLSSIEHAIGRAIKEAGSAARRERDERTNQLAANGNPFGGFLAGKTPLDDLFAQLRLDALPGQRRTGRGVN